MAVAQNGLALYCASPGFQEDAEIVAAAVAESPFALRYASPNKRDVYRSMKREATEMVL